MKKSNKRNAKYPWKKWLRPGSRWKLIKGKDFDCNIKSFIVHAYTTASLRGLRVSLNRNGTKELSMKTHKG